MQPSLKADRGHGIKELVKILRDLFGDAERLTRHAGSILLGVSQAPFNDATKRKPVPMEVGTSPLSDCWATITV